MLNEKTLNYDTNLGSISPNYYMGKEFPNKVFTVKFEKGSLVPDKILEDNIETKILVYEDRVRGWFLDFARKLTKETNSEFVVLMICVDYLEGNQQFREGRGSEKGESTKMLKRALKRIFAEVEEDVLDLFIDRVRHGLFHDAMTRKNAMLQYGLDASFFLGTTPKGEKWIKLDPALFLINIAIDFELYLNILRDKNNKRERENFEKYWEERYG